MWTIEEGFHDLGALELYEARGTLVLIKKSGKHPIAVCRGGRSTKDTPHIEIDVNATIMNGKPYYNGVTVTAIKASPDAKARKMEVFRHDPVTGVQEHNTPHYWIESGKAQIGAALAMLNNIDAIYAEAMSIIGRTQHYQSPLSREEYISACAACQVQPMLDNDCLSYGVRYGQFSFPTYPAKTVVEMFLARLRMLYLDSELNARAALRRKVTKSKPKPKTSGQLWKPCGTCGNQPIYMPLNLCMECLPRSNGAQAQ